MTQEIMLEDAGRRFDAGSDGKIPPVGLYGEDVEINEADPKSWNR